MKTINITQKQYDNLIRLSLPLEVMNTESEISIFDYGKWKNNHQRLLLKKLYITNGPSIASKLYNVSLLGDNKDEIGMEELVIPIHLASIKRLICAFTTPEIEGINLGVYLHNSKISNEDKIEALYKVGKLLKKSQKLKIQNIPFHFGDLQEYNFILGDDQKIYAVDLDSCYLNTPIPQPSYYLSTNKNLGGLSTKYRKNRGGIVYPTDNSDLLCYNMMILNTIGRDKISSFDISTYYDYIHYLESLGFGKDIIRSFQSIYLSSKNINPCDFLDQIPKDKIGPAGVKIYQRNKKR